MKRGRHAMPMPAAAMVAIGSRPFVRMATRARPAIAGIHSTSGTFTSAVLEHTMRAGFTGQGPSTLTEYTPQLERPIDLPNTRPYDAMIDHVLACLTGREDNLIEPASALPALELTLEVQHRLTHPAG